MDVFKGFPDEDSIVNYTLNQAYQDNVSVFASEWPALQSAPPCAAEEQTTMPSTEHAAAGRKTRSLMRIFFLPTGVIFQTNKDGTLPPHVLYKIRQNSSFTEKTNEIRRAYWRPGPNTGGKFYFLYGFVWIQGKRLKCKEFWMLCSLHASTNGRHILS